MKIGSHRVSGPALVVIAAFPVIAGAAFVYLNTYYPAAAERYQPIFPPIAVMVSALTAMLGGFLFATIEGGVSHHQRLWNHRVAAARNGQEGSPSPATAAAHYEGRH